MIFSNYLPLLLEEYLTKASFLPCLSEFFIHICHHSQIIRCEVQKLGCIETCVALIKQFQEEDLLSIQSEKVLDLLLCFAVVIILLYSSYRNGEELRNRNLKMKYPLSKNISYKMFFVWLSVHFTSNHDNYFKYFVESYINKASVMQRNIRLLIVVYKRTIVKISDFGRQFIKVFYIIFPSFIK